MGIFPPTFTFIRRREPIVGPTFYGENRSERPAEQIHPYTSTDPIRYSDFWRDGKPKELSWSRMPVWFGFNFPSLKVQDDTFRFNKISGTHIIFTPLGGENPLGNRANISRPSHIPYGDISVVSGGALVGYTKGVSHNGLTYDFGR